jgi:8-amino-7-oxononanoate synthase
MDSSTEALWDIAQQVGILPRVVSRTRDRKLIAPDGSMFLDFVTASYLGLEFDERCLGAMRAAMERHGLSSYAVPLYVRSEAQATLERELAEYLDLADAVLFNNVTTLHASVLPVIWGQFDRRFAHPYIHHSMRMAVRGLPGQRLQKLSGDSGDEFERSLKTATASTTSRSIVLTDGVFSMSGEIGITAALDALCADNNLWLYVDDSHGFGVTGGGVGSARNVRRSRDRLFYVGSFHKSCAVPVSFIAGPAEIIASLRKSAASLVFSAAVPEYHIAGASQALGVIRSAEGDERRQQLRRYNAATSAAARKSGPTESGIVAISFSDPGQFVRAGLRLHEHCIAFCPVTYPAIEKGEMRIRLCLSASHAPSDVDALARALTVCV